MLHKEFNGGNGEFKSSVTGKVYSFKATRDNSDKRRALQELKNDEREVRDKLTKRLGREPSLREMLTGASAQDTRPIREKIRSVPQVQEAMTNSRETRLAELKEKLNHPLPSSEKAQIKRRIAMLTDRHKKERAALEAKLAEEKRRETISSDLLDARINYDNARLLPGFTADDVRITKSLHDRLENGEINIEDYRKERDVWEKSVKERREQVAIVHERAAQEQRELAKQIRAGEVQEVQDAS